MCVQVMCNILKVLNQGYNFALDLTSIEGLHNKLWSSKVLKISISKVQSLRKKWHLDVAPVANHKKYHKGEGGGFP